MAITIETIREARQQAKKLGKPVKLGVGEGLRLNVSKSSAVFQLRYRIKDVGKIKERTLTLDKLAARTDVTLARAINDAINLADAAKKQIKQGFDPTKEKQIAKASNTHKQTFTVKLYFDSWAENLAAAADWSVKHKKDMTSKFKLHVSPYIGELPLNIISRQHISNLLDRISDKPATYKKIKNLLNMLFEDAVASNKIEHNPVPKKSVKAVSEHKEKQLPAITSLPILHNVLACINTVNITPTVRVAALLQAHTALRSQTVVAARWVLCSALLQTKLGWHELLRHQLVYPQEHLWCYLPIGFR